MIDLNDVRDRIAKLGIFNRVGTIVGVADAIDNEAFLPPAAFVSCAIERASPNRLVTGRHRQMVSETVSIVWAQGAESADDSPNDVVEDFRRRVVEALVGWRAKGAERGFNYVSFSIRFIGNGMVWPELLFEAPYHLVQSVTVAPSIDVAPPPVVLVGLDAATGAAEVSQSTIAVQSEFADNDLALRFTDQNYWKAGVNYPALADVPGYSHSRAGQQGASDSSDVVVFFAADAPAINDLGFHAFDALTNYLTRSQDFGDAAWIKIASGPGVAPIVTTNAAVAPDGTMTADRIQFDRGDDVSYSLIHQPSTISLGPGHISAPIWLKSATGSTQHVLAYLLQAGYGATAAIITVTDQWKRFVFRRLFDASASAYLSFGSSDHLGPPYVGSDQQLDLYAWQGQIIPGNFPLGGPDIATAASAAAIGESLLSFAPGLSRPIGDEDFACWVVADLPPYVDPASPSSLLEVGTYPLRVDISRNYAGVGVSWNGVGYGYSYDVSQQKRVVGLFHRRGAEMVVGAKAQDEAAVIDTQALVGFSIPGQPIYIGRLDNGTYPANGTIREVRTLIGTLSDDEITAILEAA